MSSIYLEVREYPQDRMVELNELTSIGKACILEQLEELKEELLKESD